MKKFLLTLSAALVLHMASAQYYSIKQIGISDSYDWAYGPNSGAIILDKPNNDVLSATQTVPFAFTLYGTSYTQYKASDNGYITFDAAATTSDNAPATLPSTSKPKNSIFGFWSDLELKAAPNTAFPIKVTTYTYGTAPNRVHVIEWFGVSKKGVAIAANADVLVFAIRLYEDSHFDIVYSWGGNVNFTGTAGTQDGGTNATTISGSPSFAYPLTPGGSQDKLDAIVYVFKSGAQPSIDATVVSTSIPAVVAKAASTSVAGKLANYGTATITSLTMNYKIDAAAAVTDAKTSLSIAASGGTYSFTHATPFTNLTPGVMHSIKIWASNINGAADANNANDTLTYSFFVNLGTPATKYVLLEEATGGWCGYCPDGHLKMRDILAGNPDVIGVTHHNADGMINTESDILNTTYAAGYPSGYINRTVSGTAVGQSRSSWDASVATAKTVASPVNVTITNKSYNATTKQLSFTVNANFVDYAAGDIRLGAMIVEDNVRGNDVHNTWTQHNYYAPTGGGAGGTGHELYNEPEWMVGYYHRHVVRAIPSGAFGTAGVIPTSVAPTGTYSKAYTWVVPAATKVTYTTSTPTKNDLWSTIGGWGMNKLNEISIVGFVANYNTDVNKRQILNAKLESFWSTGVDTKIIDLDHISADVYPNPSNGDTKVQFTLTQTSDVNVKLVNALGQEMKAFNENNMEAGNHEVSFDVSDLATGVYFAIVSGNTFAQASTKFVVSK